MTEKELLELDGIPQWGGRPIYPAGAPMQLSQITWIDNETLQDKFLKRCRCIVEKLPINQEDECLLKNYILYYVGAPIFRNEYTMELLDKDLMAMPLDKLLFECMNYGIDPL